MKKKRILIVLAVLVVLAVPFSVFAATSDTSTAKNIRGFFGIDVTKLNDQQKSDVKDYSQKMVELQKDFINKMVTNGAMTKEQADSEIKRINEAVKNAGENGFVPGFGMGKRGHGGPGGRGGKGGLGFEGIDTSKLTEQQKTELIDYHKKMAELEKELINKMVASNLLTKEQGESSVKRVNDLLNNVQKDGFTKGIGILKGGFHGYKLFGVEGIDTSKLTEQQKADFTDFSTKTAGIQKEMINKLVAGGAMTKEQGDTATKRIDTMLENQKENGFSFGMGKGHGRFGGRGK